MEVLNSAVQEDNIQNSNHEAPLLISPHEEMQNVQSDDSSDSSDEEKIKCSAKRTQRLSDSDSSQGGENKQLKKSSPSASLAQTFSSDNKEKQKSDTAHRKSRIRNLSSDSDSDSMQPETTEHVNTKSRTETKRRRLQNKFKQLHRNNEDNHVSNKSDNSSSSADSDNDLNSIEKIRQTIKERTEHLKSTLYDPDTSDEETNQQQREKKVKMKKGRKSIQLISPKPMRMTAKDAMENMQKIKSESNRMLREKEVSLPYHRPKALSLKDLMSKRRPAVAADGKALPIKMNEEQLKQYVKSLEERQKEVIQLCKSDTEDEEDLVEEKEDNKVSPGENIVGDSNKVSNVDYEQKAVAVNKILGVTSDDLYDDLKSNLDQSTTSESLKENESVEKTKTETEIIDSDKNIVVETNIDYIQPELTNNQLNSESDSQFVLHYTGNSEQNTEEVFKDLVNKHNTLEANFINESQTIHDKEITPAVVEDKVDHEFSDEEIDMNYIDALIENAEITKHVSLPGSTENVLNVKPKLTGVPGTVIDLDSSHDATTTKTLSGVELLKERYIFFSKLKTPDEIERDKEKTVKPGTQHLKLKLELEEIMAEQRSLEWSKRLEEGKTHHMETDSAIEEDEIEKLEAKLEDEAGVDRKAVEDPDEAEDPESQEELVEDDCDMEDRPRKRNGMLDDEAAVSDDDDAAPVDQDEADEEALADNESEESSDESSESETEAENKPKKGRILKAFEDSDDEDETLRGNKYEREKYGDDMEDNLQDVLQNETNSPNLLNKNSQDDELQLAQVQRSFSEDIFASQSSGKTNTDKPCDKKLSQNQNDDKIEDTQSFSIMDSNVKGIVTLEDDNDDFAITCDSQEDKVEPEVVALLEKLPQNLEQSQLPIQTQGFGDDVLALCTGNFYDSKFISQNESTVKETPEIENTEVVDTKIVDSPKNDSEAEPKQKIENCDILKSILDELDSPEFEDPKPNKFFPGNSQDKAIETNAIKKKFVIDSDDEASETVESSKIKKKKKKRMENRALQISDDEIDEDGEDEGAEYESELDDDNEERIVEYDSEENEVITTYNPQKPKKKAVNDFFEDEAELSSNEEWSGDEDERGLDRMEKEEGDQDHFHQGRLQKELGIIHMREVLDQDKREVRMIQELLFEDGDLGDGHRQRRFRWKNINGEEGDYTINPDFAAIQDEDFEMEEQWRKERYEREMFLKNMREKKEVDSNEILFDENMKVNMTTELKRDAEVDKNTVKDMPSPRKPLGVFQGNYRGSLLFRGGSSLSRLAALAAPLVESENTTSVAAGSRNFVFAALSQSDQPKVQKRKANTEGTPRLMKKLKTEQNNLRNSLLDHLNP